MVSNWMLSQRHVEHLVPPTGARIDGDQWVWQRIESIKLRNDSAVALTEHSITFLDGLLSPDEEQFAAAWDTLRCGNLNPSYNEADRFFGWGRNVLKQFRQTASNQELVLRSAEE